MTWNAVLGLVLVIAAVVLIALNYEGQEVLAGLALISAGIFCLMFPSRASS